MLPLFRIIKFALQDFWRNFWLSLVTITVLILALFSVNILIGLNAISESVIASVEEKVDINVLFNKDVEQASIENFKTFLNNIEEIDSYQYFTKQEVLENFKQENIDKPDIQEALAEATENPFNDTIIIKAQKTSDYDKIIQKILSSEYEKIIEKNFSDPQKIIAFVENTTSKIQKFGLLLTLMFSIIALLIVFNTVRVIIYTHKEEIGVMRLVGATNWFIRTPYLMEATLYALLAMVVKIGLLYLALYFAQPYLVSFLQYYNFDLIAYFNSNFINIFGLELVFSVLLTIISSSFAIRKYLKV